MSNELAVWLFAKQVGTLSLVDGRLSFAYHPNWLANPDAVALSCSLPLQAAPFDDIRTRPFFAGLLPSVGIGRQGCAVVWLVCLVSAVADKTWSIP